LDKKLADLPHLTSLDLRGLLAGPLFLPASPPLRALERLDLRGGSWPGPVGLPLGGQLSRLRVLLLGRCDAKRVRRPPATVAKTALGTPLLLLPAPSPLSDSRAFFLTLLSKRSFPALRYLVLENVHVATGLLSSVPPPAGAEAATAGAPSPSLSSSSSPSSPELAAGVERLLSSLPVALPQLRRVHLHGSTTTTREAEEVLAGLAKAYAAAGLGREGEGTVGVCRGRRRNSGGNENGGGSGGASGGASDDEQTCAAFPSLWDSPGGENSDFIDEQEMRLESYETDDDDE
jgi:hypothetical protein